MTEISRRQFAAYAVAVVLVVLLGGRALRAAGSPAGSSGAASAAAFPAQGGAGTAGGAGASPGALTSGGGRGPTGAAGIDVGTERERLLVHVAGAVERPGVYELGGGARIQDAVRKAGGGRGRADLDALNLAAKLTDGQQIVVARRSTRPSPAAPGAPAAATSPAAAGAPAGGAMAPVDVNTADATQLEALDGVGPAIAAKIVDWRTQNGPFASADDLAQVPGIGPKKLEAMRSQVIT